MCEPEANVSVIIPVFNGARWLARQLDAVRRDSAQPFQTVVADNGSTDDSAAIAQAFSGEMTIVVVDASARRGQAHARNLGATVATGDHLLFLDQDDQIAPGYVEAMVAALRSAELVAARMDGQKLNRGWRAQGRALPQISALPRDPVPWAYGCTLGVRRSTFERLGGFDDRLGELGVLAAEDVDFCWRASTAGVALTFVDDAVLHYQYPTTLRGFFQQGLNYGFAGAAVEARHGRMPLGNRRATLRSLAGPLRLVLVGPSRGARANGLFLLGRRLGRVKAGMSVKSSQRSTDYIELLGRMHRELLPRTYVEIGVSTGRSLSLALPGTKAVGVDPEPYVISRVPRTAKIARLTSDEFFRTNATASGWFGNIPLDMAFIDGMHLFEFALRDFIQIEKWCAPGSVVLVHDCYPMDEASAARVRTTRHWTGDVWKLVLCLKEFRPDLTITTVQSPPSGLCVVTGLDPGSRVLESRYTEICERFIGLDYGVIADRRDEALNAVPDEWATVRGLLPREPFRTANATHLVLLRSLRVPERAVLLRRVKRSVVAPLLTKTARYRKSAPSDRQPVRS